MKIFITGATGLLGRDLVPVLAREHKLFILSRQSENIFRNLGLEFISGDLARAADFKKTVNECEVILHAAGSASAKSARRDNFESTKNLLAVCRPAQKIVYISSINAGFKNPGQYAQSKKMAEEAIMNSGLAYLIFRPALLFNSSGEVYVAKLIRQILKFPFAFQPGNGQYCLQPLFTGDLAQIVSRSLSNINNRIIPVAGKQKISINKLVRLILAQTRQKPVISIPLWALKIAGGLAGFSKEKVRELSEDKTANVAEVEREFQIDLRALEQMLPQIINHVKSNKKAIS